MNPLLSFMRLLSDPTIALLLFSTGSAALLAEIWSPNFVTGILGALMIILALIGLGTLPLNVGGPAADRARCRAVRTGADRDQPRPLGVGGLICFVLGASALFTGPVDPFSAALQVASPVIAVGSRRPAGSSWR